MYIVAQEKKKNKCYLPHMANTKEGAVKPYRQTKDVEATKKKSKHLGHYDTHAELGNKWQMDVKHIPAACYVGTDGIKQAKNGSCTHTGKIATTVR